MINPVSCNFISVVVPKLLEKAVIVLLVHNLALTMLGILVITFLIIGYLAYRWHMTVQLPQENGYVKITEYANTISPDARSQPSISLQLPGAHIEEVSHLPLNFFPITEEVPQAEELTQWPGFDDDVPVYQERDLGDECDANFVSVDAQMDGNQVDACSDKGETLEQDLGEEGEEDILAFTLQQPPSFAPTTVDIDFPQHSIAEDLIDVGPPQYSSADELIKAIRNPDLDCFGVNGDYAEQILRPYLNDFNVMLAAVERDGQLIRFASAALQDDRRIVVAAVRQNGIALRYLGDWQDDRDIVNIGIISGAYWEGANYNGHKDFYCALAFASETLQNDVEMAKLVAEHCPKALDSIGNRLWKDKKKKTVMRTIVIKAVQKDKEAFKFARSFQNDPKVLAAYRASGG